jgi:hypothetical protein
MCFHLHDLEAYDPPGSLVYIGGSTAVTIPARSGIMIIHIGISPGFCEPEICLLVSPCASAIMNGRK